MFNLIILLVVFFAILLMIPKYTTGRILYTESFVPDSQVLHKMINSDLSNIPVKIEIPHRKLYKIKWFRLLKPVLELLPSKYSIKTNKKGKFGFWAYPFDVVHIIVGEEQFRQTFMLRHKVIDFAPQHMKILYAVLHLFSPVMLHEECIEIHTTLGKICGYADKTSAIPGEDLDLMISTKSNSFSIEVVRVGEKLLKVDEMNNIAGTYQPIDTKFPSTLGCGWNPTMKYRIPEGITSGCYLIKLKGGSPDDDSFIPVIVKPDKPQNEIAVLASTNTWHAYNSWGGQNYYINYTSLPSKYVLSTERPFDLYVRNPVNENCETTRDHLLVGERLVWSWLEREGYSYDLYSDIDLHSQEVFEECLSKYKTIVISTHNEYWSFDMINHLKKYIKNGGNVASLSGNTLYKEVRFPNNNIIVLDGAYLRHQGFGEETVLGVAQDLRGFMTWAPYKVMQSSHWVFEGTNLKDGDLIGTKGLNVSPEGQPGASGWETDKIFPEAPKSTTLLAKGTNADGGGADMVFYQEPGEGAVFSVGSINYGGSLLVDENISRITKNVLERFLG